MDYMRAQAGAVAPQTFIDSRVTNNNTHNTVTMDERSDHNQRMNFIDANLQGLGATVAGQQQTNAQLTATIDRMFKEKVPDPVTVISGTGGPGPDPGGGGAAVINVGKLIQIPAWPHLGIGGSGIPSSSSGGGPPPPPGPPAPKLESAVPTYSIATPRVFHPAQADQHVNNPHKVTKKVKDKNAKRALVTKHQSEVDAAAMEEDQSAPAAPATPAAPTAATEARSRNTAAAVLKRKEIAAQRSATQTAARVAKAEAAQLKQEAQVTAKAVKAEAKA